MPIVGFTDTDLNLYKRQQQIEWLHECAERPGCPGLIHREFFADDDVDVYELIRDTRRNIAGMREQFYNEGRLTLPELAVLDLLYRGTVN